MFFLAVISLPVTAPCCQSAKETLLSFAFRPITTQLSRGFEMLSSASDYGPFAPAVGYAGAIMATGAALFLMWGGKMQKWRPPDEDLPGTAQTLVILLCGVGMVVQWYVAAPDTIGWLLGTAATLAVACVACFLRYTGLLFNYGYIKVVATSQNSTTEVRILGGRELLPAPKRQLLKVNGIQALLAGAAYNADLLWSRKARSWVKRRVLLFFILTLVAGTSALTAVSFAT
jgi:hypothetical protein